MRIEDAIAASQIFAALLCAAACAANPGYHRAEALYTAGDYGAAEAAYRDFLRENPRSSLVPAGHLGLAWTLFQLGRFDEAASEVERIRARFPGHPILPAARLLGAKARFAAGDYPRAAEEASALVEEEGRSTVGLEAKYLYARALFAMLRHRRAAEVYEEWLHAVPEGTPLYADALLARADALFQAGEEAAAAAEYRRYADAYPKSAERARALAMYARLVARTSPDSSAAAWEEYLEDHPAGPDREEALERLTFLLAARRGDAAETYALRLFRTGGETAAARAARFLIDHYDRAGARAKGRAFRKEVVARLPLRFAVARDARADLLVADLAPFASDTAWRAAVSNAELPVLPPGVDVGRILEEADDFLKVLGDHPRAGEIARMRATALFVLGRWAEAEEALAWAMERYGASSEDRLRLAEVRRVRGDLKGAEEVLAGLLSEMEPSDPRYATALYRAAIVADARGDVVTAVRRLRRLREVAPGRLTPIENAWWRTREEEVAALAAAPSPKHPTPAAPGVKQVYLHGFREENETSGFASVLTQVLAAGLAVADDYEVVPAARVTGARRLFARPGEVPPELLPLRSTVGADFLIGGTLRGDTATPGGAVLELVILHVRPEGVFPLEETFRIPPRDRLAFPRRLLERVKEKIGTGTIF